MNQRFLRALTITGLAAGLLAAGFAADPKPSPPPSAPPPTGPLTEDTGKAVGNNQNSRTAGENGPVLLDDFHLLQKLARFDRERIPERVVHARGTGAHGQFVCAKDMSEFTKAKLFAAGKTTPVFVRFSIVIPRAEGPEQLRDPRGFATKFYTDEGNWDLVGNNLPVFFIRDGIKFPDLIHSLKPSPITNQQDTNRFFDFFSLTPESTNMMTYVWSDRGTPTNYREMDGFGVNTLKWVNAKGEVTYVKFNWRSKQGVKTNTDEQARAAAAKNHSGFTADLYEHITDGKFPSWDLAVQLLKPADFAKLDFDPLDATKEWRGIPETVVGTMTLNKVPDNFFQFTEQSAFDPGVVVPGVEPSEDKLLQGRIFSYPDTQRYRVGTNYQMLEVNRPASAVSNNNQDGLMNTGHNKADLNYEPSRQTNGRRDTPPAEMSKLPLSGTVVQQPTKKTLNFRQAGELYESFSAEMKTNLIKNLADDLGKVKDATVKLTIVSFCYKANANYGTRLAKAVGVSADDAKAAADKLKE